MKKIIHILVFLSVASFNTKYAFAQESKKEIGICGDTISFVLGLDQEHHVEIGSIIQNNTEYCDDGRFEKDANVLISLFNNESREVYSKEVFLSLFHFNEVVDPQTKKFIKTNISKGQTSRIVKLPKTQNMGVLQKIRITELTTKFTKEFDLK